MDKNLVLIGMPGAGKSTIGVILAKTLGMKFIDTDLSIQEDEKELLQDIIIKKGINKFLEIEERVLLNTSTRNTVVATGGSAVYSDSAMNYFKQNSLIIFLDLKFQEILKRLNNIKTRGIVIENGETLENIYNSRQDLYEKYKDIKIDCNNKNIEEIISDIIAALLKYKR